MLGIGGGGIAVKLQREQKADSTINMPSSSIRKQGPSMCLLLWQLIESALSLFLSLSVSNI